MTEGEEAKHFSGRRAMGGSGQVVETDETYFGTIPKDEIMPRAAGQSTRGRKMGIRRPAHRAVLALVERGGRAGTFHIAQADQNTVSKIMRENVAKETRIHTDESNIYNVVPWQFAQHETVKHTDKEYVRGDVTTNTVEGYFSIFSTEARSICTVTSPSTISATTRAPRLVTTTLCAPKNWRARSKASA